MPVRGINWSIGAEDKRKQHLSNAPTNLEWFARFAIGCKKRMGQDVHPQFRISIVVTIVVMVALMRLLEQKWMSATTEELREHIALVGAYSVLSYCASLRGMKVLCSTFMV